jgi:RNA polymerase sigma-70 factor, ECF subfamily
MIAFRIDARLSGRIDVEDVIQEVHLQASQHLSAYVHTPDVPFYLWLRGVAGNVLLELHRRHLGTKMRDARREVSISQGQVPEASSQVLAWDLADSGTSPSNAAMKAERQSQLQQVVDRLPVADKEVLSLHISEKAAGMRYVRALKRLREELAATPGGLSEWRL